jgi:hypothetical protein
MSPTVFLALFAALAALAALLLAALFLLARPAPPRCDHWFVDGFGAMGDAVTCRHCGLSKYPEALPPGVLAVAKRRGRFTPEGHPNYREHVQEAAVAQMRRADHLR